MRCAAWHPGTTTRSLYPSGSGRRVALGSALRRAACRAPLTLLRAGRRWAAAASGARCRRSWRSLLPAARARTAQLLRSQPRRIRRVRYTVWRCLLESLITADFGRCAEAADPRVYGARFDLPACLAGILPSGYVMIKIGLSKIFCLEQKDQRELTGGFVSHFGRCVCFFELLRDALTALQLQATQVQDEPDTGHGPFSQTG